MANTEKGIRRRQMRDAAASIDRSLSTRRVDTYLGCRSLNLGVLRNAAVAELAPLFDSPDLYLASTFSITDKFRAIPQALAHQICPSLSEAWTGK